MINCALRLGPGLVLTLIGLNTRIGINHQLFLLASAIWPFPIHACSLSGKHRGKSPWAQHNIYLVWFNHQLFLLASAIWPFPIHACSLSGKHRGKSPWAQHNIYLVWFNHQLFLLASAIWPFPIRACSLSGKHRGKSPWAQHNIYLVWFTEKHSFVIYTRPHPKTHIVLQNIKRICKK
ncbi:hypothetical protein DFS34DRAFT_325340 [Phlyctochytrium arcticum]|nr:hypothetical protein DFS34DRAFT_325340 [Phlyctochytrium arcticum]